MSQNTKMVNTLILGIIIITAIILFFWITSGATTTKPESGDIVSRNGIHYHPKLDIYIKGQLQTIPAGVGLGAVESPMHTHATDNIIHLEFSGLVTLNNTELGEFFKIWGKQFNSNCIFDFCNGPNGTVKMLVNGQPNNDFEKYPMRDNDKIEIHYE